MAFLKLPIATEEIIQQVQGEYDESKEYNESQHKKIARWRKMYSNKRQDSDSKTTLRSRITKTIIEQKVAIHNHSEKSVSFSGRGGLIGNKSIAKKVDNLAEFDYDAMDYGILFNEALREAFIAGSSLVILDRWRKVGNAPSYKLIKPEDTILDQYYDINNGYRYIGFYQEVSQGQLTVANGFFNVGEMKTNSEMEAQRYVESQIATGRSAEAVIGSDEYMSIIGKRDTMCTIYQHYTTIEGKKYILTLANDRSLLIRAQEIKPVKEEEKQDNSLIPFPCVVFQPQPDGTARGESTFDNTEDKQLLIERETNLQIIKANKQAFGSPKLIDSTLYEKFKKALNNPERRGPMHLPVDAKLLNRTLMQEIPQDRITPDENHVLSKAYDEMWMHEGMDRGSLGIKTPGAQTGIENNRLQANTNLRQKQVATYLMRAYRTFWRLRYRAYLEHFDPKSEKNIVINTAYGVKPDTVKKEDLSLLEDADIKIESKTILDQKQKENKEMRLAISQTIQAGTEDGDNYLKRKMMIDNGYTEEEAYRIIPKTLHENLAENYVQLINEMENGDIKMKKLPNFEIDEPHEIYIAHYHTAYEGEAKMREIGRREMGLLARQMQEARQPAMDQIQQTQDRQDQSRAMGAMVTNNAIQKENSKQSKALSLNDVNNG